MLTGDPRYVSEVPKVGTVLVVTAFDFVMQSYDVPVLQHAARLVK
jgi:hypothetical protein